MAIYCVRIRSLARFDGLKAGQFTDVFVFSHGWNNDIDDARHLYESYFDRAGDVLHSGKVQSVRGRKFAVITILWPSKKFTDEDLIPGGGAASVEDERIDQNILHQLDELKKDPVRLGEAQTNRVLAALAEQGKALLPKLQSDPAARTQFVLLLRSMLNPNDAHPDDGSSEFFKANPHRAFPKTKPRRLVTKTTPTVAWAATAHNAPPRPKGGALS